MIKKISTIACIIGVLFFATEAVWGDQPYEVYLRVKGMKERIKINVEATDWKQVSGMPDPKNVLTYQKAKDTQGGRTIPADFSIVKVIDQATPRLENMLAGGAHISEIRLDFYKTSGNKEPFFTLRMKNVTISKISPPKRGMPQMESVVFEYKTINWGPPDASTDDEDWWKKK